MLTKFKKYLQSFHPNDQFHEVNEMMSMLIVQTLMILKKLKSS